MRHALRRQRKERLAVRPCLFHHGIVEDGTCRSAVPECFCSVHLVLACHADSVRDDGAHFGTGACRVHRLFHKRHFIGFFFHRHIAGTQRKFQISPGFCEPLEKFHRSLNFLRSGIRHNKARALLHGKIFPALEFRAWVGAHLDGITLGIAEDAFIREIGSARGGSDAGDDIAHFDVVAAKAPGRAEPAVDERHIVIVPQAADHIFIEIQHRCAVLHTQKLHAQLARTDDHVIGKRVAAKKRLSVVRNIRRLSVRPLIILARRLGNALHSGKGAVIRARGSGEFFPIRRIQHQQLHGFCDGEYLQRSLARKRAFLQIARHIFSQLLVRQVGTQVRHKAKPVHRIGSVGVGGKNIGHLRRAHLPVGRSQHAGLQIRHGGLAGLLYRDALFPAHSLVEFIDKIRKRLLLRAVVIVPDRHGDGVFRAERSGAGRTGGTPC